MGNCFGIFGTSGQLLDSDDSDESIAEENNNQQVPVYHPNPGLSIPASRLTEEEQMQIVKRIDMIQFLPSTSYVPANKDKLKECIICMCDLKLNDEVRYLPCLHTYHRACIDDWLMRSFVCPSCLRPVEIDLIAAAAANLEDANPPPRVPETRMIGSCSPSPADKSQPTDIHHHHPAEQGDSASIPDPQTPVDQASRCGSVVPETHR